MGTNLPPLCRACANFIGRDTGEERRRSAERVCAARVDIIRGDSMCESHVPIAVFSQAHARSQNGRPLA